MSQAARAHDLWADDVHTLPRRRPRVVDSWASAEDLEVLGGLGRASSATWTVLTLDRDDEGLAGYADATRDGGWSADVALVDDPDEEFFWATTDEDEPGGRRPSRRRFRRSGFVRPAVAKDPAPPVRLVDQEAAPIDYISEPPAPLLPGQRRTVVIRGRVPAPAAVAAPDRRRPAPRTRDRVGHRPDRVALWAFVLGLLLILIAVLSAGGSA